MQQLPATIPTPCRFITIFFFTLCNLLLLLIRQAVPNTGIPLYCNWSRRFLPEYITHNSHNECESFCVCTSHTSLLPLRTSHSTIPNGPTLLHPSPAASLLFPASFQWNFLYKDTDLFAPINQAAG